MGVRTLLFGSKLRIVLVALVGVALLSAGALAAGVLGAPAVTAVENRFGDVNESHTEVETDLVVYNPNPFGVSLGDASVSYAVEMNDVEMATGQKTGPGIERGNTTLDLRTYLRNERIPTWWASHLQNGERTEVTVDASVHSGLLGRSVGFSHSPQPVTTDVIGQFNSSTTRPVASGRDRIDPVAYVNETSARWGNVSQSETPIRMRFVVYNPKAVPLTLTELGYDVTMNGVAVGEGETDRNYVIPGHESRVVETVVVVDNAKLDEWWVSHLERNQRTNLRINFSARLDLSGLGVVSEPVDVPLRALTYEKVIETDIFGTKNASARTNDTARDGGTRTTTERGAETTATTTTTDDGLADDVTDTLSSATEATTTAESTTTATEETTPSETTTEDDGLLNVRAALPE